MNPSFEVLIAGQTVVPQTSDSSHSLKEGEPEVRFACGFHDAVRVSPERYMDPSDGLAQKTSSSVVTARTKLAAVKIGWKREANIVKNDKGWDKENQDSWAEPAADGRMKREGALRSGRFYRPKPLFWVFGRNTSSSLTDTEYDCRSDI